MEHLAKVPAASSEEVRKLHVLIVTREEHFLHVSS